MFTANDQETLSLTVEQLANAVAAAMQLDTFAPVRRSLSDDFDLRSLTATVLHRMLAEIRNS